MNKHEMMIKLYDAGREYSMPHQEAMAHAKLLAGDPQGFLQVLDAVHASAYIAIREYMPTQMAKELSVEYVNKFKALAEAS